MPDPAETARPDAEGPAVTFGQALAPVLALLGLVVYGMIVRPLALGQDPLPLEVVFVLAAAVAVGELMALGHPWERLQASIVAALSRALPAFLIFFAIGMLIGSWIVSGTIPMLVYYGLLLVRPEVLYLAAFLVPVVFSLLTGTSWGSAGTVGVVILGIAAALGADLGVTAGAVIGGAYFGDKLSPLSDTTNIAALAADVPVGDHVRSMLVTTVPSALVACTVYVVVGIVRPPALAEAGGGSPEAFLAALDGAFRFHALLLAPPLVVLVGSVLRKPTVPVLVVSALTAAALALALQPVSLGDVAQSMARGFEVSMLPGGPALPEGVVTLVERGGLFALVDAIVIAFLVFVFIGTMNAVGALELVAGRALRFATTRRAAVLSALAASGATNALTSNQYATSFIVADAFKGRFDALGLPRRVLSRSLEDYGTMIETVVPWTPSAVFMVATLGVPYAAYAPWQLLTWVNLVVAPLLAVLGLGFFRPRRPLVEGDRQRAAGEGGAPDAEGP